MSSLHSEAPIIWIEGLLAAGKSTMGRRIADKLGFLFLEEPVESNFYLEEFYKDPKKYAFGMQMFLLHHRFFMKQIASYEAARGVHKGVVLDRCIVGDRVFAELHWREGNISDLDWRCYNYAYQGMARTILPPTLLLYLNCRPETAYRRMKERDRTAEAAVPLEYLQKLYDGYHSLLEEIETGLVPWSHSIRIHHIICDRDTTLESEWDHTIDSINDLCDRGKKC